MSGAGVISFELVDGPIEAGQGRVAASVDALGEANEVGAVLEFRGVVRRSERGRALVALDYEAYPPMTQNEGVRIAQDILEETGVRAIEVLHSVGRVPVGACSFLLRVQSAHRAEGLRAASAYIERMKQEVPLWKLPVWAGDA